MNYRVVTQQKSTPPPPPTVTFCHFASSRIATQYKTTKSWQSMVLPGFMIYSCSYYVHGHFNLVVLVLWAIYFMRSKGQEVSKCYNIKMYTLNALEWNENSS